MKRTGPTQQSTKELVVAIERKASKEKSKLWRDIAKRLSRSRRIRTNVNLSSISAMGKATEGKWFLVPGKLLSGGNIEKPVNVMALSFSKSAIEKIHAKKGKTMRLKEAMGQKINPSNVVIVE